MKFTPTPVIGAYIIEPVKMGDDRGFFARLFCSKELSDHGLDPTVMQINNSRSAERGTLRGMHYQLPPMEETKIVRCIAGSVYDVVLDIREGSPSFGCHFGAELNESNRAMMYVPKGCAHGFLTLTDNSEVIYFVSSAYSPELERGIRWDDPAFAVSWPFTPTTISERDRSHPHFERALQ